MRIDNFDDAYANIPYIKGAADFIARWQKDAATFRDRLQAEERVRLNQPYGRNARQTFDLFLPDGPKPSGLFVFIHGGYWHKFSKDYWSHFASGALAHGYGVVMPNYTLAPEARIADMVKEMAQAIHIAAQHIAGPIVLCGHSAGGHLATRMICGEKLLHDVVSERLKRVVSISGVHDLRPLLRTQMNAILKLDQGEAEAESPALLSPHTDVPVDFIVGSDERPAFLHQNNLLAQSWHGLGLEISNRHVATRHHFDVIDELKDAQSNLMKAIISDH